MKPARRFEYNFPPYHYLVIVWRSFPRIIEVINHYQFRSDPRCQTIYTVLHYKTEMVRNQVDVCEEIQEWTGII